MSSSYTSPRAGGTKPASTEEISDQIDELRSQLQKLTSTVTSVTGKQIKSTQESLETAIRDNPFAAVGIALGLGFLSTSGWCFDGFMPPAGDFCDWRRSFSG
jgi:ElaB/YqjD/DUF883 family membrane-anchored ribosome-binding protein